MIEFRVLGSVEAVDADGPLPLGGPQQRALLAVLLLHRGELVSADRLIEDIWGEQAPATAAKIVQGYVSNLRKVLGEGLLVTRGHGYVLLTQPGQVDADRFQSLAADGDTALRGGDPGMAADLLVKALSLWRGPALAEFTYSGFAQPAIAQLEEARMVATEQRLDAELELGRHAVLLPQLEALVRENPLRERLVGQLMLAQYRGGRQAGALATYRHARARLIDELGLEPGPELQELEAAVLAQDPKLASGRASASRRVPVTAFDSGAKHRSGPGLILAGGGLLLAAAVAAVVVALTSGSTTVTVRAEANSIAAIDPRTNDLSAVVPVGDRPSAIAAGRRSLWVANLDDQTISQVDPRSLQRLHDYSIPFQPTALATAGGAVWVVGAGSTSTALSVDRIEPQFATVVHVRNLDTVSPVVSSGNGGAIAAQGDQLWVAPSSGALLRISSPAGHALARLHPGVQPTAMTTGYGAVWIADNEADDVSRIDPTGLVNSIPLGHDPSAVATGDGAVWVADTADDKVVKIDPGTQSVETTIPVGIDPTGVVVAYGSVWVADSGNGAVSRINPANDRVVATIPVGGSPQQLAVAAGRVWVTVDAAGVKAPVRRVCPAR